MNRGTWRCRIKEMSEKKMGKEEWQDMEMSQKGGGKKQTASQKENPSTVLVSAKSVSIFLF